MRSESDPFELDDVEFVKRYRLTKELIDELKPLMKAPSKRIDLDVETKESQSSTDERRANAEARLRQLALAVNLAVKKLLDHVAMQPGASTSTTGGSGGARPETGD